MAEPVVSSVDLAAKLIEDYAYEIREALKALATHDRYALEDAQWERFYLIREVVGLAYGFTDAEASGFLIMTCGEV